MKTLEERVQTAKQLHAAREAEMEEIVKIILEDITDDLLRSIDTYRRTLITQGLGGDEESEAWGQLREKRMLLGVDKQRRLMSMLPELYLS